MPKTPDLNEKQAEIFVSLLENEIEKQIARWLFLEKETNSYCGVEVGYTVRHIERKRSEIIKKVLRKLLDKRIPQKVQRIGERYHCKCGGIVNMYEAYCCHCGHALDWYDISEEMDAE